MDQSFPLMADGYLNKKDFLQQEKIFLFLDSSAIIDCSKKAYTMTLQLVVQIIYSHVLWS